MLDHLNGIGGGIAAQKLPTARSPSSIDPSLKAGSDFTSLLMSSLDNVGQTLRHAESTSVNGVYGLASTQEVVTRVMAAEQTLQAAIAVRDKVVSAYQEISRMSI